MVVSNKTEAPHVPFTSLPQQQETDRCGQDTEHAGTACSPTLLPTSILELAPAGLLSVSVNVSSQGRPVRGVLQRVHFWGWRFHRPLEIIQVLAVSAAHPLFFQLCSMVWMDHRWPDRSPVGGHLGGFQFGAITNKVAVNIPVVFCVNVSLHCSGVNVWVVW